MYSIRCCTFVFFNYFYFYSINILGNGFNAVLPRSISPFKGRGDVGIEGACCVAPGRRSKRTARLCVKRIQWKGKSMSQR